MDNARGTYRLLENGTLERQPRGVQFSGRQHRPQRQILLRRRRQRKLKALWQPDDESLNHEVHEK